MIANNQLGRMAAGDTIWLVTVNGEGELVLAGRMLVDKITDYHEAARIVGESQLALESPLLRFAKKQTGRASRLYSFGRDGFRFAF